MQWNGRGTQTRVGRSECDLRVTFYPLSNTAEETEGAQTPSSDLALHPLAWAAGAVFGLDTVAGLSNCESWVLPGSGLDSKCQSTPQTVMLQATATVCSTRSVADECEFTKWCCEEMHRPGRHPVISCCPKYMRRTHQFSRHYKLHQQEATIKIVCVSAYRNNTWKKNQHEGHLFNRMTFIFIYLYQTTIFQLFYEPSI